MTCGDRMPVCGTTLLTLADEAEIAYRRSAGEEWVRFVFFGPVEVELEMSRSTISRCRDLFDAALVEIDGEPAGRR